jgi:Glyoxalase-like domain
MQVDHVIYAAGPAGLEVDADRLAALLGAQAVPGGRHPGWGTRNALIPLAARAYLEVVEVIDRPVALGTAFGSAVAARSDAGGGWVGWVMAVDDVAGRSGRLGREVASGSRRRPDGVELRWRTLGVDVLVTEPELPFLISWDVPDGLHPASGARPGTAPRLTGLELVGDAARLSTWIGADPATAFPGITVTVAPAGSGRHAGLTGVTLITAAGDAITASGGRA